MTHPLERSIQISNKNVTMKLSKIATLIAAMSVATTFEFFSVAQSAKGVALTGLTGGNTLVFFDSATPGSTTSLGVSGVGSELLLGIDYRPADGQLYGVTGTGVFTIDSSGNAARINTFTTTFDGGTTSGVDFNPAVDALRIVGANGQNFGIGMGGRGVTGVQIPLAYATGDPNVNVNPTITAAAYTNSFAGPASTPASPRGTVLYDIDSNLNVLVRQDPPGSGNLFTVGNLGVDVGTVGGFDIFSPTNGENMAFAAFALEGSTAASLYTINLTTGTAGFVGQIGSGTGFNLTGLAAPISPTAVPEPSAIPGLIIVGIGTGLMLKRRKRKSSAADKK